MIHEILSSDSSSAITCRELASMFNVEPRIITKNIERERREGHPICAKCDGGGGYYLAKDKETLSDYCGRLKHRETELFETRQALISVLKQLPGRKDFE